MTKNELRDKMKKERRKLAPCEVAKKSLDAGRLMLGCEEYNKAGTIMIYAPLGNEVETAMIAECAIKDGKQILYPVTDRISGAITPVKVNEDTEFVRGAYVIREPIGEAYCGEIDLVILPGLAFDREGGRLGFGKGCYDAFLVKSEALKVGLCYGVQIVDIVPTEEHDVRMDMIVTDEEIIYCKKKNA
jgi:5-formyltetrahydrofolate cyclo-ligase